MINRDGWKFSFKKEFRSNTSLFLSLSWQIFQRDSWNFLHSLIFQVEQFAKNAIPFTEWVVWKLKIFHYRYRTFLGRFISPIMCIFCLSELLFLLHAIFWILVHYILWKENEKPRNVANLGPQVSLSQIKSGILLFNYNFFVLISV